MKAIFAVGLFVFLSGALQAQVRASAFVPTSRPVAHPAAVQSKAVVAASGFSSNASSRPLGGVALPTFPSGGGVRHKSRNALSTPRYIGPVYYVPNGFDSTYDYTTEAPPPPPLSFEQPTVPRQLRTRSEDDAAYSAKQPAAQEPVAPGDPIGALENYYLIAYRDHSIYSALAYWVEGETLHYVTTQNTHNQASLAFIDVVRTTRLNADRNIPFVIPGQ